MRDSIKKQKYYIYIILLLEILLLTYFTYKYGVNHIDTDDSAEMVLAHLLNRVGIPMSREWYYSTEIRVLNTQLVMAPLFSLFSSWNVVRTAGTAILLCIFAVSYLLFCRLTDIGRTAIWLAPILLWPFSLVYYDFVLFGLYYIPHLSIMFICLGLFFSSINSGGNKTEQGVRITILSVLSCLAGMGGLRLFVVFYTPLFVATVFNFVFDEKSKWNNIWKDSYLMTGFIAAVAAGVGYVINVKVLTKIYSFANWSDVSFTELDFERLGRIIKDMILTMGYREDRGVLSISGIINLLVLLSCILFIYIYVQIFKKFEELEKEDKVLVWYSLISLLATAAVCVLTNQNWTTRYLILPMINFVIIWSIYIKIYGLKKFKFQVITLCLTATIFLSGVVEYRSWMVDNKNSDKINVLSFLESEDYTFGFADWWGADVLTELTDGKIHMCKVTNWKEFSVWYWLMEKDYLEYAQNRSVFVLIENKKMNFSGDIGYLNGEWKREELTYLDETLKVYDDGIYSVYVYENLDMLSNLLHKKLE